MLGLDLMYGRSYCPQYSRWRILRDAASKSLEDTDAVNILDDTGVGKGAANDFDYAERNLRDAVACRCHLVVPPVLRCDFVDCRHVSSIWSAHIFIYGNIV